MEFVESDIFTARITELLDDDAYGALQAELIRRPKAGVIIPGLGGLRKIRWGATNRGKRGGLRVIYYYWSANRLEMIYAYDKADQGDLTPQQKRMLQDIVRRD